MLDFEKKVPEKGDENVRIYAHQSFSQLEKKSPRKGTKTELSFAQMNPYVSREDPQEGDETYLTWQDSGDQDPLMEPGV